jgi:carbonic anhydrase
MKLHDPAVKEIDASVALNYLKEGNKRFVEGNLAPRNDYKAYLDKTGKQQSPFAAILTCSDSRTCPEIFFDQKIGDIFVLRNAGNIATSTEIGSLEFAVSVLKTILVVVVGHTMCGAVHNAFDKTSSLPTALQGILDSIGKNIKGTANKDEATTQNVKATVAKLKANDVINKAMIIGAEYDLATGVVSWH